MRSESAVCGLTITKRKTEAPGLPKRSETRQVMEDLVTCLRPSRSAIYYLTKTTSLRSTSTASFPVFMSHRILKRTDVNSPFGDFFASNKTLMTGFTKCCHSLVSAPSPYDLEYLTRL